MKRLIIPIIAVTLLLQGIFSESSAQFERFGNFVTTGSEDAQELFEAYLTPYVNGFGASLTGGWYNTAKPHKLGGFDLTLSFNTAVVPEEHRTFNVNELDLGFLKPVAGSSNESPTIAGKRDAGPYMMYNFGEFSDTAFTLPSGTGVRYVPSPMIQVGVGLFKGTEVMGRYLPDLGTGKGKIGLWGVGLKHDVKQWIPGLSKVPVLNISLMGGYTKLHSFVNLNVDPGDLNLEAYSNFDQSTWEDQQMLVTATSFTTNLLVSADLPIVCFYGGAGIARTKANLKLEGNFPMIQGIDTENLQPNVVAEEDPIDFEVKNSEGAITKPRLNAGVRFKFGVFTLNLDYTRATYNVATLGIGISFR